MAAQQEQPHKNRTPAFEKPAQPVPAARPDEQQTCKPEVQQQQAREANPGVVGDKDGGCLGHRRQCACPDGSAG